MKIALSTWLKEVWQVIEKQWLKLYVAAFLRNLLAALAGTLTIVICNKLPFWNIVFATIFHVVVWCALESGYLKMCLRAARNEPVAWSDLFSGLSLTPVIFVALALYFLATSFGIVVLVIPGIFVCIRFSLSILLIVDQRKNLLDAFNSSLKMTQYYSRNIAVLFLAAMTMVFCPQNITSLADLFLSVALCLLYLRANKEEAKA